MDRVTFCKRFQTVQGKYLIGHFAFDVHGQFDHVVVRGAREEDLACVELIQRAAHRPHIDAIVIRLPNDCPERDHLALINHYISSSKYVMLCVVINSI